MSKRFPKIQAAAKIEAFTHNSKVSVNEPDWGGVDKTKLPRPAFADMGEAGKVSTWSFPHHWIQNGAGSDADGRYTTGTMLLHKGGLNAAWAAAQGARSGQKASPGVISHLEGHRKALNLSALPSGINAVAFSCTPKFIEAAVGTDGKPGLPKVQMLAYTGGAMNLRGWDLPVVVDLAGVKVHAQAIPMRRGHDPMILVGHTTSVKVENGQIMAEGVISFETAAAQEVVSGAKNGFPWQASIGADPTSVEFVGEGEQVTVNGQAHQGPLYVVRASDLNEISFVDLGADRNTVAKVAAKAKTQEEEQTMTEEQKKALKAALAAIKAGKIEAAVKAIEAHADVEHEEFVAVREEIEAAQAKAKLEAEKADPVLAYRAAVAEEQKRIVAVTKAAGSHEDIRAEAIEKGWTPEATELKVLRAERAKAPVSRTGSGEATSMAVLEAAVSMACGISGDRLIEKHKVKAEVVEAADREFGRRIGLQQVLLQAARANGYDGTSFREGNLRQILASAFSTQSLPGIFSNVLNKRLEMEFNAVENTWREIASTRPVNDFKTVTAYRLDSNMKYAKVAPDGELKHGEIGESTYSNKADTYGKIYSITRQDIINDDLGALTAIPRMLGRGAALAFNEVFWTIWLGAQAAGFFDDTAYGNLDATTASLLSVDGMTLAERKFKDLKDPKGFPLGLKPVKILVPNALGVTGTLLLKSMELRDTTASTKFLTMNPHMGKFQVVESSYLNTSALPGGSAKHWYMLADPAEMSAIEACFLGGQELPTIQTAEADFNVLGIQMRGYHDFGVALHEPRAAIKLRGEA